MNITNRTDQENELLHTDQFKPNKQYDFFPIQLWQKKSISSQNSELDNKSDIYKPQKQYNTTRSPVKIKQTFLIQRPQKRNSRKSLNDKKNSTQEESSFFKAISKQSLVQRFANNLLSTSYILPQRILHILSQENYLNNINIMKYKQKNFQLFSKITQNNKIPVIFFKSFAPGTSQMILLDLFILLTYIFSLWVCLFKQSFRFITNSLNGSEFFFIGFLTLELILSFYRPVILQGHMIYQPIQIWKEFVKKQIFEDILNIILWLLLYIDFYEIQFFNEAITIILSIIIIKKVFRKYDFQIEQIYLKGINSNLIDFIKLVIMILTFAHIMACIWHYIGNFPIYGQTWIQHYGLEGETLYIRYIYSYYWAVVTMVTVGYGDLTPQNYLETCFTTILILLSSFMFAFSMNSIGVLVKNISDQKQKYKKSLILINSYMRRNNVDPNIQIRVSNHIKQISENGDQDNQEEIQQCLNSLPKGIFQDLQENIQAQILNKITALSQQFSDQSLNLLGPHLQKESYTPQQMIYKAQDKANNLYFISQGEVQLIEQRSGKVISILKTGDVFGEYSFFTGQETKETCLTTNFVELYKISRENLIKVIKHHRKDYERYCKIKDSIVLHQNYFLVKKQCSFCFKYCHNSIDCNWMTYQPNLYLILQRQNNQNNMNFREKFYRREDKYNSKYIISQIREIIVELRETQPVVSEKYIGSSKLPSDFENPLLSLRSNQKINPIGSHQEIEPSSQSNAMSVCNKSNLDKKQDETFQQSEFLIFSQSNTINDFETMFFFRDYFPHNNAKFVIKQFNQEQIKKQQKNTSKIRLDENKLTTASKIQPQHL